MKCDGEHLPTYVFTLYSNEPGPTTTCEWFATAPACSLLFDVCMDCGQAFCEVCVRLAAVGAWSLEPGASPSSWFLVVADVEERGT